MKSIHIVRGLLAVGALGIAGCDDDGPVSPGERLIALVPRGAVQAAIQSQPRAADGTITFVVRVLSRDVDVSAYQGVVTFDAGAFEVVRTQAPEGRNGETHILNPDETAAGRIRFAAFTATTFDGTDEGDGIEAFRFMVKPLRDVEQANLVARLDVVGAESGTAVAADRIHPSSSLRAASGNFIR